MSEPKKVFAWEDKSTWSINRDDYLDGYTHIRGYHGYRPISIESYYNSGFLPPDVNEMLKKTLSILGGNGILENQIVSMFYEMWNNYPDKGIYFTLSKKELLEKCGHYLIYGSELICSIARQFGLDAVIKSQGTPTLFTVDIPINQIDFTTGDIELLYLYVEENNSCTTPPAVNYGFPVYGLIEQNLIMAHEHPKKIHDPLNWGTYYTHSK